MPDIWQPYFLPTHDALMQIHCSWLFTIIYQLPHSLRQLRLDLSIPDLSLLRDHLTSRVSPSPLFQSINQAGLLHWTICHTHTINLT